MPYVYYIMQCGHPMLKTKLLIIKPVLFKYNQRNIGWNQFICKRDTRENSFPHCKIETVFKSRFGLLMMPNPASVSRH